MFNNFPSIIFKNVSKKFFLQEDKTFKEALPSLLLGKPWAKEFSALNDISFEIKCGETVGIVGNNGAGKSAPKAFFVKIIFFFNAFAFLPRSFNDNRFRIDGDIQIFRFYSGHRRFNNNIRRRLINVN